ncbi:hypothetical protein P8935_06775 [Telmatobacter sp. DSM 110680]|uniref:Uncharacterized protein n=1 Tax=Telmatobacter sp. DSM 110680 TaxID=3036704 RepID=A0AAU7DMJ0_9BACT
MRLFRSLPVAIILLFSTTFAFPQAPSDPHNATHQDVTLKSLFTAPVSKLSQIFIRNNAVHPDSRMNQNYTSAPAAPLIFTSPVFNQSIFDTATLVQTSTAQGDPYVTPVTRIISSDAGVNDTAPLYTYHNCNYTAANSAAPCVGAFMVSQNNPGDLHNGVWGINPIAIQRHGGTNSLTYGVEANVFNETGLDPGPPGKLSPSTSQIFGIAATIAGNSTGVTHGTSAFLATDENSGSYWYDGLWVERAIYAALEAGPVGGGSDLQWSVVSNATGSASPKRNFASIPQADIASSWNGHASMLEVLKRQFVPSSAAHPAGCYDYTFSTALRQQFCDDGSNVFLPASNAAAIRITPDANGESGAAVSVTNAANSAYTFLVQKNGATTIDNSLTVNSSARAASFQIGPHTVLPSSLDGYHGSGAKVQISDGTGRAGNLPRYDSAGNVTDSGVSTTQLPVASPKAEAGHIACIKSIGPPIQIGSCSTRPDATGACSCN